MKRFLRLLIDDRVYMLVTTFGFVCLFVVTWVLFGHHAAFNMFVLGMSAAIIVLLWASSNKYG